MFGGEIDAVNHRRLPAFDIKAVESIQQHVFVRSKVLNGFDLVAADEALEESFVAALVAVQDCLGGVEQLGEYRPRRAGRVDGQAVNHWNFLLGKEKDRLRSAVFQ